MVRDILEFLVAKPDVANAVAAMASAAVAAFAFVVSAISLYVSHRTLRIQREHNILSVRPVPHVSVGDYENLIFVKLRNNGTGPLMIEKLEVEGCNPKQPSLVECMPDLPHGIDWSNFVGAVNDRSIPPGGEVTLLELAGAQQSDVYCQARDSVRKALGRLTVVAHYSDIYRSSIEPYKKRLNWFERSI